MLGSSQNADENVNGKVFEERHSPYPITKVWLKIILSFELKIADKRRNILERFKEIFKSNYLENANRISYQINDLAVINLQNKGFGESQDEEEGLLKKTKSAKSFFQTEQFCKMFTF